MQNTWLIWIEGYNHPVSQYFPTQYAIVAEDGEILTAWAIASY